MASKIYIEGNFLIAKDSATNDLFFKVNAKDVVHYRTGADLFAFFLENGSSRIDGYTKRIQLGRQEEWNTEDPAPPSKTTFEFSDIVDSNGGAYASADVLDLFLNENLGSQNPSSAAVQSVTGLDTDNTDPTNPIVKVSVDGVTVTGLGTTGSPLIAVSASPSLKNVTSTDTFSTASETINCTSGTFTVNLPTAVGIKGVVFTLVNSGTGVITLDGSANETINGSLIIELSIQYVSRTVQSDGANWIII